MQPKTIAVCLRVSNEICNMVRMIDQFRALSAYNRWMNSRLYGICGRLSDEQRKRDQGAFFKSIHGTLNHLLLADRIWMARFTNQPFAVRSMSEELCSDFDDLARERALEDARIDRWIASLTAADLSSELKYTSQVKPQPRQYPLWFAITHFFNHQTHHRGQITTLLSQLSVDVGVTDLIWMPENQPVS